MLKAKQAQIKIQKIIVKNIVVRGDDRKFHKKNIWENVPNGTKRRISIWF